MLLYPHGRDRQHTGYITLMSTEFCYHLTHLLQVYIVKLYFNIDNPYFEGMVNQIYPPELQLNKANTSDTEAPFLDLHLSITNGFVSSKNYDKRDDFDFDKIYFPFFR